MANGNKLYRISMPCNGEVKETEKAYGVNHENAMIWLPKSQIQELIDKGDFVEFWCPEWLITEKGLDLYIDTSHEPSLFG